MSGNLEMLELVTYARVHCPECAEAGVRDAEVVRTGTGAGAQAMDLARAHALAQPGHTPRATAVTTATFKARE